MKRFKLAITVETNDEEDLHNLVEKVMHDYDCATAEGETDDEIVNEEYKYTWRLTDAERREHLPPDLR